MAAKRNEPNEISRNLLAYSILFFAMLALTGSAGAAIFFNPENAILIVNIVLPVISSWVGTILAFYFGKENFEAANQQIQELVQQLTPEERAKVPTAHIMRRLSDTTYVKLSPGKSEQDIKLREILANFTGRVSRLPIIDVDERPKYMLHESSINKYIVSMDGSEDHTLADFINAQAGVGVQFGINKGYVVVSEKTSIEIAKRKMEAVSSCQDIFTTESGGFIEPMTGWVSNIRIAKFLGT